MPTVNTGEETDLKHVYLQFIKGQLGICKIKKVMKGNIILKFNLSSTCNVPEYKIEFPVEPQSSLSIQK